MDIEKYKVLQARKGSKRDALMMSQAIFFAALSLLHLSPSLHSVLATIIIISTLV